MPFLTLSDGESLHYEVHGAGPPLLLVSGLGGVASFWKPHVAVLAEKFRVILHDHRGAGASSKSLIEYSVSQMTDDLLQLMNHLDIGRADFVGHSTGGAIGQTMALDFPERIDRLVLSATWTAADDYFRRLFDMRSSILSAGGIEAYVRSQAVFMFPPDWIRRRLSAMLQQEEETIRAFPPPEVMLRRIRAIQKFNRQAELGNIAAPCLVIGARDDMITPAYYSEELGRLIPDAQTVILPTGGHFFPVSQAEAFRNHLSCFLTATESNTS
ncbi:MAG: pyrimidine utilization protein D [Alphaproteobacteria bacterium]